VALNPDQAARLAQRLRALREEEWPDVTLTQAQLAEAFSADKHVASATVSTWESSTRPKTPTEARLRAYARFFATRRSLDGSPHLVPTADFTDEERNRYRALEKELLGMLVSRGPGGHSTFTFDEGPVTVICPEAPPETRGALADPANPNFTKLQQYGDQDALIEVWGHLWTCNPTLDVSYKLAPEVTADHLSSHIIVLGGIAWNDVTSRIQDVVKQVPILQITVADLPSGEIFEVDGDEDRRFYPRWQNDDPAGGNLIEDVGYLARLTNPFNSNRTLIICNGIHSRGVLGAVRCLTDKRVRAANEQYVADRFPSGQFAMLLRVQVVASETMSPDLQDPSVRLYEWPPRAGATR
jgi:hypothetical protein